MQTKKSKDLPFIIGITGGIGSGKSTAAKILQRLGAYNIDTDEISRQVMSKGTECHDRLSVAFPQAVVDGIVQRSLLRELVFASEESRKKLNALTHPYIIAQVLKEAKGKKVVVVQVPLLFESGFDKLCDVTLCILSHKDSRINRITRRDNFSKELALAIIATQLSDEILIEKCDYCIENNGSIAQLETAVEEFYQKIKERF